MAYTYKAVDPESGIKWCVRAVFIGDSYGIGDCLTYGNPDEDGDVTDDPLIEFYDMDSTAARIMADENDIVRERGQFVSRYYLSTLNRTDWSQGNGLNLDGGVDRWSVSGEFMVKAMDAVTKRVISKEVEDA